MSSEIKALILAGGFGTRLKPLTDHTPKPLLPIVGKPVLTYSLERLKMAGIKNVVISVNSALADQLKDHYGNGARHGIKIKYIVEPADAEEAKIGAVGAISYASAYLDKNEDYVMIGSDNFAPSFDFAHFISAHRKRSYDATVALYAMDACEMHSQFGMAIINKAGRIVRFQEKPKNAPCMIASSESLVSTCYYVITPKFMHEHVPRYVEEKRRAGQKPDNLGEIFEKMLEWGATINGYVFKDFWIDIGKPAGYLKANHYVMGAELGERIVIDPSAVVSPSAKVGKGPILVRAKARIDANAIVQPFTEVGEGASIGKGSSVSASMIFPNAVVGKNCSLDECIIDSGKRVKDGTRVERHSIY